jgi:hypothetical protein
MPGALVCNLIVNLGSLLIDFPGFRTLTRPSRNMFSPRLAVCKVIVESEERRLVMISRKGYPVVSVCVCRGKEAF